MITIKTHATYNPGTIDSVRVWVEIECDLSVCTTAEKADAEKKKLLLLAIKSLEKLCET